MKLKERINKALSDNDCHDFLKENLDIIRNTILVCEKRMNRFLLILLFLIGITELTRIGVISTIELFGVTLNLSSSKIIILALPCLIAFYAYSINKQRALSISLNELYSAIVKKRSALISKLEIDQLLIAQLSNDVEYSFSFGIMHFSKKLMMVIQIAKRIFSSLLPSVYLIYFYITLDLNNLDSYWLFRMSIFLSIIFFVQSMLLVITSIIEHDMINLDEVQETNSTSENPIK